MNADDVMTTEGERALRFDVGADYVVPDVAGLLPPGGRVDTSTERLRGDYSTPPIMRCSGPR